MPRQARPLLLTTEEVSISQTFVTIKAMHVNNRQMTQSVFKQLPRKPLFDCASLQLNGVVWGWVNYDLAYYRDRHFVFQSGSALHRCSFCPASFDEVYKNAREHTYDQEWGLRLPYGLREYLRAGGWNRLTYERKWNQMIDELSLAEQLFIAC